MEGSILKWVGVRLIDGQILCDLEGVRPDAALALTIGQYESANVTLTVTATTPPEWLQATLPGGAALIAYLDTGTEPTIMWGGIVTQRLRTKSTEVKLSLMTPEYYFSCCQVGNYAPGPLNQDTILHDLVASFGAGGGQIPWVLNHLPNASTTTQTITYLAGSNTTLYKALQDLSALQGGPEWVCDWAWNTTAGTILPRINYGARVGQVAPVLGPAVTFEPDSSMDWQMLEEWTDGKGANVATIYGRANQGANGGTLPSGTASINDGRPTWQYVSTIGTTSDPAVLSSYAASTVARMDRLAPVVTCTLPLDSIGRQFGNDWFLGDDVGNYVPTSLTTPTAMMFMQRVKSVQILPDRIAPIFY